MIVPVITFTQLKEEYLEPNGYLIEDSSFWEEQNRVIVRKGDYTFPLQYRDKYFYLQIVRLFEQLGIPVPPDHQKCFDQHMKKREKEPENKKDKNDDH